MIANCPHCDQPLNLTEVQKTKVAEALAGLAQGMFLKLGCPNCRAQIKLQGDGSFFDAPSKVSPQTAKAEAKLPVPPKPPDVGWLAEGEFAEREVIEDVPMVMILMEDGAAKSTVVDTFEEMGYLPVPAESGNDAIERMRFVNFAAVVLSDGFEKGGIANSVFHAHMRGLPMSRRRYMYYILIGQRFHTFYDLEALSYSANLVVNLSDANYMNVILRKGLNDYEELFGPFLAILKEHGKI